MVRGPEAAKVARMTDPRLVGFGRHLFALGEGCHFTQEEHVNRAGAGERALPDSRRPAANPNHTSAGCALPYFDIHSRWTFGEISLGLISLRPPQKTFV